MASVDWVVNKLGLSDLPKQLSYDFIAAKLSYQIFELYFDEIIVGSNATSSCDFYSDEKDYASGAFIGNGYCILHDGRKVATNAHTFYIDAKFFFAINEYYFHDEKFYPSDKHGMAHKPYLIDVDSVAFDKNQVISCAPSNILSKAKGEQSLLKAMALLARKMADNDDVFKKGNSVNAKAFKDHILSLAKEYDVTEGGLKSLDDKLNSVLIDLDLKDIPLK